VSVDEAGGVGGRPQVNPCPVDFWADAARPSRPTHLDENVAHAGLAERGVLRAVHNADGLAVHDMVVEHLPGALGCRQGEEEQGGGGSG